MRGRDDRGRGPSRHLVPWVAVSLLSVLVAGVLAVVVTRGDVPESAEQPRTPLAARATTIDARAFLDTYVDAGRVVRTDQGGDTVSEGQAYGMLIALGADDREAFEELWRWTRENLGRDDGLISWRWQDGSVVDPSSAADADLDIARALVQAGDAFGRPSYVEAGVELGRAILDHETVSTPAGLVLVAGQWATDAPYSFNPSYVSPAATDVLARASGDPRWTQVERGSRAAVDSLTRDGQLPPDWAQLDEDGTVRAVNGPGGQPVQYSYDAARTVLRHAESCDPVDRRLATDLAEVVARSGRPAVATYDLAGSPQTDVSSPLVTVAQASGLAAAGQDARAVEEIRRAGDQQQQSPTYYGDAWTVLGPMLLTDPALGGCPLLEDSR
ncbi:endoglucanase [Nocardioides scoriae]|uniref:Endoglucanase n=1 Tax=Nocardioides scoriae TaxID=642780 RepID=A0A1H1LJA5_9ACTN|nr:glycosyl hydrolase family 8 [Nocardioides scoriae]SDR74596.1 endoglucanase [Nocardioides scoriae]